MTIETVLAWSIARSILVATSALPISLFVWRACSDRSSGRRLRQLKIAVAVLPLFVPDLLTGFTYRLTSARLLHSVAGTEALYAGLLLFRIVALQVAVRLILPGSVIGHEAMHSWKLNQRGQSGWRFESIRMHLLGPYRTELIAWMGGCLLCFQDFETAALLQINRHPIAWTVWLFDAHAAGEPLVNSLKHVGRSVVFQLLLLVPVVVLLAGGRRRAVDLQGVRDKNPSRRQHRCDALGDPSRSAAEGITGTVMTTFFSRVFQSHEQDSADRPGGPSYRMLASAGFRLFGLLSLFVVLVWPVFVNGGQLIEGLASLVKQKSLMPRLQQILISVTTCTTAAMLAVWICKVLRETGVRWAAIVFMLPGLCGSLVTGLALLALFQLPALNAVYDSWLPMLLGQTLLLIPRAWLLVVLLEVLSDSMAAHSGRLLLNSTSAHVRSTGRNLLWRIGGRRWLIALAVLTHWSFWDVSIVSTLRPVRFEPIVTRLYNEMHYGRTATLIAITVLSMLIPIVGALLAGLVCKQFPGRAHQQKGQTNG